MMQINLLAVLVCGVIAMALGFVWYGPLFGKKWMHITKMSGASEAAKEEMKKSMWKLYLIQFALALFQAYVLSWYVMTLNVMSSGVHTAFSIWVAFIMPTLAGASMWNGDSTKISWSKFLIQAGYQLVLFVIFGYILGIWK